MNMPLFIRTTAWGGGGCGCKTPHIFNSALENDWSAAVPVGRRHSGRNVISGPGWSTSGEPPTLGLGERYVETTTVLRHAKQCLYALRLLLYID